MPNNLNHSVLVVEINFSNPCCFHSGPENVLECSHHHHRVWYCSHYCVHSLLTMQNLDLSLIIDRSWYLFLSLPCRRGYVQKNIYLGISSSGHTLSDRVCPEKDIPRYIFFWALPREWSGKDLPRYIFSRPHPVRQGVVCNLWYSFCYYIASP